MPHVHPNSDPRIDAMLRELPRDLLLIAREVRRSIHAEAPDLVECVKWNAPNWKGKGLVLCLMLYPKHVNLGIWRGAELAERLPRIEGTGKSLRHVRLQSVADAGSEDVRKVIRAAVKLDLGERPGPSG